MNYGEEFIKLYNKEFSAFKKEIIKRIKIDYGSPVEEMDLLSKYKNEIQGKKNEIEKNDNKKGRITSIMGISLGYMLSKNYKFDRTKNIIERDIYENFEIYKMYSQYKDFHHFLQLFSEFLVLNNFSVFFIDYHKQFCYLLRKEDIESFFEIRYMKADLNKLVLNEEKVKNLNIKRVKNKIPNVNSAPSDNTIPSVLLDNDEKLLLLHFLFICNKKKQYELKEVEFLSVLRITNGVHENKRINDLYDTDYKKLKKGLSYYSGGNSASNSRLDQILKICNEYKLTVIKSYIRKIYKG